MPNTTQKTVVNTSEQNIKMEPVPSSRFILIKATKILLIILFLSIVIGGLIYFGYLFGVNNRAYKQKPALITPTVKEVPYGDESIETDVNYKKDLEKTIEELPEAKETPWLTYVTEEYGFLFNYPSTIFIKKADWDGAPELLFLDKKQVIIPKVFDGFLTPVEITMKLFSTTQDTADKRVAAIKDSYTANTFVQTPLSPPLKGIRVKGTMSEDNMFAGEVIEEIILEGPKNLFTITYLPNNDFERDLFEQILKTVRFLDQTKTVDPNNIASFNECIRAGNPVRQSTPRVCLIEGVGSFSEE